MRDRILLIFSLLALLVLGLGRPSAAQSFTVRPDHPRLLITAEDLPKLRAKCGIPGYENVPGVTFGEFATEFQQVQAALDRWPTYGGSGIGAAFVHLMLGSGETKYLNLAKTHFAPSDTQTETPFIFDWLYNDLTVAERTAWANALLSDPGYIGGNFTHQYAEWTMKYYWGRRQRQLADFALYDNAELTASQKTAVRDSLQMIADFYFNYAIPHMNRSQQDGGWHEGFTYGQAMGYGPEVVAWFLECWRTATGQDYWATNEMMTGWGRLLMYARVPATNYVTFSDDNKGFGGPITPHPRLTPLAAARTHDPIAQWCWKVWSNSGEHYFRDYGDMWKWSQIVYEDTTLAPVDPATLPTAAHLRGKGLVYMRSDWDDATLTSASRGDATYATFKAGNNYTGHQNVDQGAFEIHKLEELALDSGIKYGDCEHIMKYSMRTVAHNALLIHDPNENYSYANNCITTNDGGQIAAGYVAGFWETPDHRDNGMEAGDILSFDHTADYTYARGDVTAAYNSTVHTFGGNVAKVSVVQREFLYLRSPDSNEDYFVVSDRITTTNPTFRTQFLLHMQDEPLVNGAVVGTLPAQGATDYNGDQVTITRNTARLYSKTLLPAQRVLRKRGGPGFEFWVDGVNPAPTVTVTEDMKLLGKWRVEVEDTAQVTQHAYLHVLHPDTQGGAFAASQLVTSSGGNMKGAFIAIPYRNKVALFSADPAGQAPAGPISYTVTPSPANANVEHLLINLQPGTHYDVVWAPSGSDLNVSVTPAPTGSAVVNSAGVLHFVSGTAGGPANELPTVSATATPTAATTQTVVAFSSVASDPDGTITSYNWSFGDGALATGQSASHTYSAPGTYTASVTVRDNGGLTATATVTVTVTGVGAPTVSATASPTTVATGSAVNFTASASSPAGTITSYAWTFGDGGTGTGATVSHTYATAGTYPAAVSVTDSAGGTANASVTVTVSDTPPPPPPAGVPGAPASITVPTADPDGTFSVTWTAASGTVSTYKVYEASQGDFSDQQQVDDWPGFIHGVSGRAPGVYYYRVRACNTAGCGPYTSAANACAVGTANQPPTATISATPSAAAVGDTITFTGSGTDADGTIASGTWAFGDGQTAPVTAGSVTHTYSAAGSYTASITVTDNGGASGTASTSVAIGAVNQPPTVTASATPAAAEIGTTITLSAVAADADGTVTSVAWSFGDGSSGSGATVTHVYTAPGVYTASVTATDDAGATATASTGVTITIPNMPPTVVASGDPAVANAGAIVTFSAVVSDPDGTVVNVAWDFGDGTMGTGPTVTHAYTTAGTFTASVTVTDNAGATASDSVTITSTEVSVLPGAPASISVPASDPDGTYDVTWTAASGTVTSYKLYEATQADFADQRQVDDWPGFIHGVSGRAPGVYYYRVHACNAGGCGPYTVAANPCTVGQANQAPTVAASADFVTVDIGTTVTFTATAADADGTVTAYAWDFGDGASGTGASATHAYTVAGTYTATVTVTDDGGATATATVTLAAIAMAPHTVRAGADPMSAEVGTSIAFLVVITDGTGTTYTTAWNFGDGGASTETNPTHMYTTPGTYTATVAVTRVSDGVMVSDSVTVTIRPPNAPPTVSATADPSAAAADAVITFQAVSMDPDGTVTTLAWDFGDGTTAAGPTVTHAYTSAGTFAAVVTATDNAGATATATVSVTITGPNVAPTVTASATPLATEPNTPIAFAATATDADGTVASVAWNFGDGATDAGATVSHAYAAVGTYTATVTATDDAGASATDTVTVTVAVSNLAPTVSAAASPATLGIGQTVTFTATASDPDGTVMGYAWAFDDGASVTTTASTTTHAYSAAGTYGAHVTVSDNGGATASATVFVSVVAPNQAPLVSVAVQAGDTVATAPVTFTAVVSDPDGTVASGEWSFGDGATAPLAGNSVAHAFASPGTYLVSLTVTDDRGATASDALTVTISTANVPPIVAATASPTTAEPGTHIRFTAQGSDPDGQIVGGMWDFGDGTTEPLAQARTRHAYTAPGTYRAVLTLTDDAGASTSSSVEVRIGADMLVAIAAQPGAPVVGEAATFTLQLGAGFGAVTSCSWTFGDGAAGTTASNVTTHTYRAAGTYTVAASVVDAAGARASASTNVTVGTPVSGCTLQITSPNGGESIEQGMATTITWSGQTAFGGNLRIVLVQDGVAVATIANNVPNSGSYAWAVPADVPLGSRYTVLIHERAKGRECHDFSDATFSIVAAQGASAPPAPPQGVQAGD